MRTSLVRRLAALGAFVCLEAIPGRPALSQAWIAGPGTGTVSLSYQVSKVRNHLLSGDLTGFRRPGTADGRWDLGRITGQSLYLNASYVPLENLQLQANMAYVGGTYKGTFPESAELDDGKFHGAFQDASLGASYMFYLAGFGLTPGISYSFPTHEYAHHGHVAPGRGLTSFTAQAFLGRSLDPWISGAFAQLSFAHSFVEDVDQLGLDSDRYGIDLGYSITPEIGIRSYFSYFEVKNGIDWYSTDFAGDWNFHDAAAASVVRRAGGSLSYQFDASKGVSLDIGGTVSGVNTHDGIYYTLGTSWRFVGPSFGER